MELINGRWVDENAAPAHPPELMVAGSPEYRMVNPNRWLVIALVLALMALAALGASLYVGRQPTAQERAAVQLVEEYYAAWNTHNSATVMALMTRTGTHAGNGTLGGDFRPVSELQLRRLLDGLFAAGDFSAELTGPPVVTIGTYASEVSVPNRLSASLSDGRTVSVTGVSLLRLVTVEGRLLVSQHAWWEQGYLGWSRWAGETVTPIHTCPAGSTPDRPGPVGQARPTFAAIPSGARLPVALDSRAGRLVALAQDGTWTFDVCTNTWTPMKPTLEPTAETPMGWGMPGAMPVDVHLVYEPNANLTLAFSGPGAFFSPQVWAYSLPENTWTQLPTPNDQLGPVSGAVFNPLSGQVLLYDRDGGLWAYEVQTNTATQVDQGTTRPPEMLLAQDQQQLQLLDRSTAKIKIYDRNTNTWTPTQYAAEGDTVIPPLLSYDSVADRLTLTLIPPWALPTAGQTWIFDPQARTWTQGQDPPLDVAGWGVSGGEVTFDTATGCTVIFIDGALATYNTAADEWAVVLPGQGWPSLRPVDGMPTGPLARIGHTLVYDPVNQRTMLLGGRAATGTADSLWQAAEDLWAYALPVNTWIRLAPDTRAD